MVRFYDLRKIHAPNVYLDKQRWRVSKKVNFDDSGCQNSGTFPESTFLSVGNLPGMAEVNEFEQSPNRSVLKEIWYELFPASTWMFHGLNVDSDIVMIFVNHSLPTTRRQLESMGVGWVEEGRHLGAIVICSYWLMIFTNHGDPPLLKISCTVPVIMAVLAIINGLRCSTTLRCLTQI